MSYELTTILILRVNGTKMQKKTLLSFICEVYVHLHHETLVQPHIAGLYVFMKYLEEPFASHLIGLSLQIIVIYNDLIDSRKTSKRLPILGF